jgi:hypothetical protein
MCWCKFWFLVSPSMSLKTKQLCYWVLSPMPKELEEELLKKTRGHREFVVIPRRWVRPKPVRCCFRVKSVERTFAWLSFCRRLNRDYEYLPETSETLIYTAMIRLMVRRLAC